MARYKKADNPFRECIYEGIECVQFETVGKNRYYVIVDKEDWYSFLKEHSWTAIKTNGRITVKTSINKQSKSIWRLIIEKKYSELDYWGATIDHINNDPLDNRFCNLRIYNSAILNSTNVASKYQLSDMQYIYKQRSKEVINGYKVHYNLSGETFYKNFSVADFGSAEKALNAAKQFRDETVFQQREQLISEMIKKTRDIEFERGLRDKIQAEEIEEIRIILKKYGVI